MKSIRTLFFMLCLSACQASQPTLENPPSPVLGEYSTMPLSQQELRFNHPHDNMKLFLEEEGTGILLTGTGKSAIPLSVHRIKNFGVQEQPQSFPELIGTAAAARTTFLNSQGKGSVILVNSSYSLIGGGPANISGPQNVPLELHTVPIQNFNLSQTSNVVTFAETFSDIQFKQGFVDKMGNGYISLQVMDPVTHREGELIPEEELINQPTLTESSEPNHQPRLVFVPIQNYEVQKKLESDLDFTSINGSTISGIWLNSSKSGLVLYQQQPDSWRIRNVRQGKLTEQSIEFEKGLTVLSPDLHLDEQGNGHIFAVKANGNYVVRFIRNFEVGQEQALAIPALSSRHSVVANFQGDSGTIVAFPFQPDKGSSWQFKVYPVFQGRVGQSQTFDYPLRSNQISGFEADLVLTSQGKGFFAWNTLEQGGSNGAIHIQALENFQITGNTNWSKFSQSLPQFTSQPTPPPMPR